IPSNETCTYISDNTHKNFKRIDQHRNMKLEINYNIRKNQNFLMALHNCTAYLSYDYGDSWKFSSNINCYNNLEYHGNLGLYVINYLYDDDEFEVFFSYNDLISIIKPFKPKTYFQKIVIVKAKIPIIILINNVFGYISLNGGRYMHILDKYKQFHYLFDIKSQGWYGQNLKNGEITIDHIDNNLNIKTITIKSEKCSNTIMKYSTHCKTGYTYFERFLNTKIHKICHLDTIDVVPHRNITCQCISNDYTCA
ncbi:hypothetical protein A3Q56_08608, partial [Intoshia linei]